jgi:DnaJ-class molecular chaperone
LHPTVSGLAARHQELTLEVDDSYKELGIARDSSDAEVKAAWRRLAARWHPDRNDSPAALRKIQRINRALEEIRKARQMAAEAGEPASEEPPGPSAPSADDRAAASPGRDGPRTFHHTMSLTLEEACAGCVKEVQGEVVEPCAACAASGVDPQPCACASCEGTGQVRQALWFGWLSTPADCVDCAGSGTVTQACTACQGSGRAAPRTYRVRVRIPAGMRHGGQLQVPARGRARTGTAGDMIAISIEILPHAFFTLDADGTVRCEVPVDGFAWMAERWTEVPTPAGLQQMRLRRGHLVYRIKGQGFALPESRARADCLVTVVPLFAAELDAGQEALVDRLVASHSGDPATPEGQRVAAWQQAVAAWQDNLPSGEPRTARR